MYTIEPQNEHLEDKNTPSSTTLQNLKDSSNKHEETTETVLSQTEETKPHMEKKYSCPPQGILNKVITNVGSMPSVEPNAEIELTTPRSRPERVAFFMIWCVAWSFSGSEVLPGGNLFGLLIIFHSAIIGGKFLELIRIPSVPPLPPLLGMLLAGFAIRNVPYLSDYIQINSTWSSILRNTALTVILIQAGLGLDPQVGFEEFEKSLFKIGYRSMSNGGMLNRCYFPLPYEFSLAMGISVGQGAVSPAVVVPSMLLLQENGYGIKKGIPTLLIAASSMDDIIAITGFNTCLSIVFSSGGILKNVLVSFRDILIGVLAGAILGIFLQYFPSEDQTKRPLKRAFLISSLSVSAVLGGHRIGLHAAGGLCTLVLSFVAGLNWSTEKLEDVPEISVFKDVYKSIKEVKIFGKRTWEYTKMQLEVELSHQVRVQRIIKTTWHVFQPLLFGLVGSEVTVASLKSNAIGICVATMSLALLIRISFTFVLMCFAGFSFKEKIFIALSWMPKATVQAVLGPLALETARISAPHLESYSKDVMTVAFLAILITAPNGALIIGILGPKILTRHDPSQINVELTKVELH
ncbi:Sodium/hydrogen exchanger 9B1 [Vulpes lagopus]